MRGLNCIRILGSPVPEGWPDTYNEFVEKGGMVEDLNLEYNMARIGRESFGT
jgi:hypothetical protein